MSAARRRRPRRRRARPLGRRGRIWAIAASCVLAATALSVFVGLRLIQQEATPEAVVVTWPAEVDSASGAHLLVAAGLRHDPWVLEVALRASSPFIDPEPGPHLLAGSLSAIEVVRRLGRLTSRQRAKVAVPEGFTQFQLAHRLQRLGVCAEQAFLAATFDRRTLDALGIPGDSAEGYLFPATYDLGLDSDSSQVLRTLVRLAQRRFDQLAIVHANAIERLRETHAWGRTEILTLASIVEKEAAVADERPLIASVFLNRLEDPDFRPARMLQSDPTAGYGCLLEPALASCAGYSGQITARMLRDAENPYNTYRRPGLPPGPICNPGQAALRAVLAPAQTDYLFFVADGQRRHTFSRTLAEHESAIERKRSAAGRQ